MMVERNIELVHAATDEYFSKWTSRSLDLWSGRRRSTFDSPEKMNVIVVHGLTKK
jgi:hypothetical protein